MGSDPIMAPLPPIARIRINDARSQGNRVIVYPMKPRTPGFWLIVATVGLLALLPMRAVAGMTPEEVKAFESYKAKAEKGYPADQYSLGFCYANGDGVAEDKAVAVKWFRKAADQGFAVAQSDLGMCYVWGIGVAVNQVEGVKWYRKAADQGFAEAQSNLGMCYCLGRGGLGKNNMIEAVKWWRKAAEQGDAEAQNNLGKCYDDGTGVARDYVEAYAFYKLAEKTNEEAGKRLATLEKFLSHEATLRGQKRSKEIQKEIDANIASKKAGK